MPRRTPTTHLTTFARPAPSAVTYSLPSSSSSSSSASSPSPNALSPTTPPNSITITLPPSSTWSSGLHWHSTHTEYLQVLQGVAAITLSGVTSDFNPSHGPITVPRYARHSWCRSPSSSSTLVVREWTDPADGEKEVFFRNLNSVILDATKDGPPNEWWLELELWNLFWRVDNWPSFYGFEFEWLPSVLGRGLEWGLTHVVLLLAVVVGWVLGVKGVYEEYTPRKKVEGVWKEL